MDDELLSRAREAVLSGVFAGPAPPAALDLGVALWHVETWWAGTELQHLRLSHATSPANAMADVSMLVLALRNLLRAAHLAGEAYPDERIGEAIQRFEQRLPGITEMRDVLEHFDEDAAGTGRFQKRRPDRPRGEIIPRVAFPPGGFLLKLGPHVLGAGATGLASQELAKTIIEVLHEALADGDPEQGPSATRPSNG